MIKVGVLGARGRMGAEVVKAVTEAPDLELVAALDLGDSLDALVSAGAQVVKESRFSGGLGIPVARDNATLDFSIQRANRSQAGSTAREAAWLLGIGMQVRP